MAYPWATGRPLNFVARMPLVWTTFGRKVMSLTADCRRGTFRWREHQQYTSDYNKYNYIREIPPVAVVPSLNRLDEHHGGVGEIPPSRESNQRAVRRRIPGGKQKKDSQWDEEAHKHRVGFVVLLE